MIIAAEFGSGQVLWSILWFFMLVLWVWLIIMIFTDILEADDLSGWGKALWAVGILVLPFLGILLYLVVHGSSMNARARAGVEPPAAPTPASTTDELTELAVLRDAGKLSDTEYEQAKSKIVSG